MSRRLILVVAVAGVAAAVGGTVVGLGVTRSSVPPLDLRAEQIAGLRVPVPAGWRRTLDHTPGLVLSAAPAASVGAETVREGGTAATVAQLAIVYLGLAKIDRPGLAVLANRRIQPAGAAQAWLLETQYTATVPRAGRRQLRSLDIFERATAGGTVVHLALVVPAGEDISAVGTRAMTLLSLGPAR